MRVLVAQGVHWFQLSLFPMTAKAICAKEDKLSIEWEQKYTEFESHVGMPGNNGLKSIWGGTKVEGGGKPFHARTEGTIS